jgi:hypothetical protein
MKRSPAILGSTPGSLEYQLHRNRADGVVETVRKRGAITRPTLDRLLELLATRTSYPHHVAVEVEVGALLKTVDNEEDALETIRRLEAKRP